MKLQSLLSWAFALLILPGCTDCHETLSTLVPRADSLFIAGDSTHFHRVAEKVIESANCVLSESTNEAHKLDAKVEKDVNEKRLSGWACHVHVRAMQDYHATIEAKADRMSDDQWVGAMETWRDMLEKKEKDHRATYCIEADVESLEAMQLDFLTWTASSSMEQFFEKASGWTKDALRILDNVIDQGIDMIEEQLED